MTASAQCVRRRLPAPGGISRRWWPPSPSATPMAAQEGHPMHEPRPVCWLFVVQVLLLLALIGWWGGLSPAARLGRLGAVMVGEHVPTVPPDGFVAQAAWLYAHRRQRLTGMVGLLVVAALVGAGEGLARRRTDVLGG